MPPFASASTQGWSASLPFTRSLNVPVLPASLRMTSPVCLVSKTGWTTGCWNATTPARGRLSPHCSSRLDDRLLERDDAGPRPALAPLLERVVIRQHEVACGGGLVHVRREADLVADLAERLLERSGQ